MQIKSLLVAASYILSYFLASYFGYIYAFFSSSSLGGTFITPSAAAWIAGLPLAVIFLVTFLLCAVATKSKWWWVGISLIPAILFEIVFDPLHIYVPIILGLIAWGLGTIAHKTLQKLAPSFMTNIA